ncbi:hypothetical protein PACILC2_43180 [Paenibacillus cisolokensis]|uniref:Uncharacterized protein n=1 Tax=Paenibacillus cisolokensis TaxID=1658519 RepID=A0ABQ4NC35_9BACL|nr:hypothetical protein [Paenibacillus cisolokensis]GIQ65750.1 hypothetical protein PACILC2_43180 [Paenibacillus cisolokensis]
MIKSQRFYNYLFSYILLTIILLLIMSVVVYNNFWTRFAMKSNEPPSLRSINSARRLTSAFWKWTKWHCKFLETRN